MTGAPVPTIEEQVEAWDAYCAARHLADETLRVEDGAAAVQAWKAFANLFLADERKLPISNACRNVTIFPMHKVRQGGAAPEGHA